MRSKTIILLLLALGCGLVASIGISQVLNRSQETGPTEETAPVWVAMAEIKSGDLLNPQNLKLEQWPKEKVPPGALGKLEQIEGKRTRITIYQGEPVLDKKLRAVGGSIADTIPSGFRAYTVAGDAVNSHGGLLHPGDRVDLLVFVSKNSGNFETGTKTILQDIKVFAVNDQTTAPDEKSVDAITAKTVTLLMTPSQAERATLAAEIGKIRLVIRAPDDKTPVSGGGIGLPDLFTSEKTDRNNEEKTGDKGNPPNLTAMLNQITQGKPLPGKEPVAAPAERDRSFNMEVIRGTEITELDFHAKGDSSRWEIGSTNPFAGSGSPPPAAVPTPTSEGPSQSDGKARATADKSDSPKSNDRSPKSNDQKKNES